MAWPRRPSLTMLVLALFTVYVAHTVRTLYHVVHTEPCLSGSRCFASYLQAKPSLQLSIFTSLQARNVEIDKLNLVLTIEDFDPHADILKELKVPLPRGMRPRGSLYAHTFVHAPGLEPWHDERAQHAVASLTTLMVPKSEEVNLVARNKNDKPGPKKLMVHWRSHLSLNLMTDNFLFDLKALPGDVLPYFKISPMDRNLYLPMLFVDQLSNRVKDLILVNDSTVTLPLRLSYTPISLSKLRLWVHMQQALHTLQDLGFSEKDGDEVKGIFADTNLYFLGLTFLVATFHLLFDFLAFKNDISFWKAKRDMVGMSIRAVSWRCFSTFVLFLFLLDEQTSLLVLIPAGVGSIIEAWKVTKAFKIQIRWTGKLPRIQVGTSSVNERQTEQFDSEVSFY
uniref:Lipid scramblase CLPTM1L n=1 Tax=Eptatretus burgeri TaxID=7764 RepID=A0A8C4PWX8_EPTBU